MADSKPKKRLVLCMGQYCNHAGQAEPLYERLRDELGDPCPAFMARGPVSWETASCLDMCGGGPNMVIYPGEIWYNQLDLETLERAIREHIRDAEDEAD